MNNEYKQCVKFETFEQFWNESYGAEYGYTTSPRMPSEPFYSIAQYSWEMGENHGYYLGKCYGK